MSADCDFCRFAWRPKLLSFLLLVALALSSYSSVDCRFITVDLGFIPSSEYNSQILDFGLWSFESPDGTCVSHRDALVDYSWAVSLKDDTGWNSWIVNTDFSWTTSRVFGLLCVVFGSSALIIALRNSFLKDAIVLIDVLIYLSISAMLCEGLFFNSNLCQSPTYWYNSSTESFTNSKSCTPSTSAFLSMTSILAYILSTALAIGYTFRPERSDDVDYYDEKSLKSWMHGNPLNQPPKHEDTHTTVQDNNDTLELSDRSGLGIRNRKSSTEAIHGSREDLILDEFGNLAGASIIKRNSVDKKMDEMSAVSWEDEY